MDCKILLEEALFSSNIQLKRDHLEKFLYNCIKNTPSLNYIPKRLTTPSYSDICKIVPLKELPKRRNFANKDELIALVHSIAHIEYSAIDLAIDAVYRFFFMPNEYKKDWIEVALDEIRHFLLLQELLFELDSYYGALEVHSSLFEMAKKTSDSVLERMAVIPRFYEAVGLDVNPKIVDKLKSYKKNKIILKLIDALNIIYKEEIEHVKKGDKWFKYLCLKENLSPIDTYFDIIRKYNLHLKGKFINIEGRKEAGFSCKELIKIGANSCD